MKFGQQLFQTGLKNLRSASMNKKINCKWIGLFFVGAAMVCFTALPVWAQNTETKPQAPAAAAVPAVPKGKPDLQFEKKVFDFGSIYKGASVSHKFKFTNKGDGVLNIGKVKTSCGCTAALTSSKTLKPGEGGTIETTFNSKNFRGRITKKIYVNSNDPDEGKVQLVIKGNILEEITLSPQRIAFNMVAKGEEHSNSFHVKQAGEKELKILDIKSDLGFISAKVGATDTIFDMKKGEKLDYTIDVTLAKNAPIGRFNGTLTIKTNLKKQPNIKYQVVGIVK